MMKRRAKPVGGRRPRWPSALPVLLALGAAALYLGLGALWLLVLLLFLALASDLLALLRCLRGLTLSQQLDADECIRGGPLTLRYALSGPLLSACRVERRLSARTWLPAEPAEAPWQPFETLSGEAALRAHDVGLSRAGVSALRVFSPLGTFRVSVRLNRIGRDGPAPVLVLPRLRPMDTPPFAGGEEGGGALPRDARLGQPDSVSGSREYQQGEPLSHVNWKLTAARRELFLKQYDELALRQSGVLYVAPFPPMQRVAVLEAALAGGALLLAQDDVLLRFDGGSLLLRRGQNRELARALAACPALPPDLRAQNDALAALANERAACAVVAEGDGESSAALAALPRGSLVFVFGVPSWRQGLARACRGAGVNLCTEYNGEGWTWLDA